MRRRAQGQAGDDAARRRGGGADIIGSFANNRLTAIAARVGTAAVLLNVILILQSLGVPIPGLAAG